MGIFASSLPGGVTPHSARKLQKHARQWHFIRAEGSPNCSDVRGAGSTSDKKSTPISHEILDFADFHDSARAHLPVLSRRLFGVCKRHLVYYFSFWYWVLVLWYAFDGVRGIGIVTTFAAEYFAFFFFFAFYVLGPCVTGADPASHGVRLGSASTPAFSFSFLSSCSSSMTDKGLGVFLRFQLLPLSPLLFVHGVHGHRRLVLF